MPWAAISLGTPRSPSNRVTSEERATLFYFKFLGVQNTFGVENNDQRYKGGQTHGKNPVVSERNGVKMQPTASDTPKVHDHFSPRDQPVLPEFVQSAQLPQ